MRLSAWPIARQLAARTVTVVSSRWILICRAGHPAARRSRDRPKQSGRRGGDLAEAGDAADRAREHPAVGRDAVPPARARQRGGRRSRSRPDVDRRGDRARSAGLAAVARGGSARDKARSLAAAERSLRRAIELNPRSPLFAGLLRRQPGTLGSSRDRCREDRLACAEASAHVPLAFLDARMATMHASDTVARRDGG